MHTAIQTPPAEMLARPGGGDLPGFGGDLVRVLSGALDSLNSQDLWRTGDRELLAGTRELLLCLERLRAETARRVAEIESRGATTALHAVRTSEWLHATNWSNLGDARRQVRAAVELAARPVVQAEALAGRVGFDQATAIVHSIRRLPCELDTDTVDACEQAMLGHVHEFDPDLMKQFGHHVVAVVAPEVGEEADRLALLREEARARGDRSFTWARDGFGSVRFRGQLPIVDAEPLVALVTAVTAGLPVTDELGQLIPIHRRQADALTQIVGAYSASGQAPTHGGDRPRVVVTISLDALRTGLGMGTLCSSGECLSAGDIRRLACDADIIPATLGGTSQILDLGRGNRLFTGPTRQALALRDQGCVFPGCNAPPTICEGHHITPWWAGGRTDLGNAVLLCPHHHRIVEPRPTDQENQWQVRIAGDGVPELLPPRFVDKHRKPRRHQRFSLTAIQPPLDAKNSESEPPSDEFDPEDYRAQLRQKWLEECLAGKNPWHPPETVQNLVNPATGRVTD